MRNVHLPAASLCITLWMGSLVLAAGLFLLGIGVAPLIDRDEPAYAEAAREMLERGDWVATWFNSRPWFDKPPLVYWSEMVSYSALGVNEVSARLPVALFGIAGLAAVYWTGRRLRGARAGALAAAVLATSLLYLGLARVALMDVPFTACFTFAMCALVGGLQEPNRARWPLLSGAAVGLAVLAKSLSAGVLFAAVLLSVGVLRRSPIAFRGLRWGYAALSCLLVAAPWYLMMSLRFGPSFLNEMLGAGNVGRFLHAEHVRSVTPLYYLPIILVGFLPWTALLPGSLYAAWRARAGADVPLLWAGITFAFFTVSQSKLPGYILPMFPALALLVGWELERSLERWPASGSCRQLYYAIISTLVAAGVVLVWAVIRAPSYLWGAALLACLGMLPLALVMWARARVTLGVLWAFGFAVATAGILGWGLLPTAARANTAKELAQRMQADGQPHRVCLVNTIPLHVPSLLFYCRKTVTTIAGGSVPCAQPADAVIVEGIVDTHWLRASGFRAVARAGKLALWMVPPKAHDTSGRG